MSSTTAAAAATAKKRKSDAPTAASLKKAKLAAAAHAETVEKILSDASNFEIPSTDKATRELLLGIAQYARGLEQEVASCKPKAKTPADLEEAADKLATAARSGIRKQMTWKPSCKTGSARWTYDGVCNDPEVFGKLLGLAGPPTFKTKKMPKDEFEDLIGDLRVSVRYDYLNLASDVNIHWKPTEGTFKLSGTYGK